MKHHTASILQRHPLHKPLKYEIRFVLIVIRTLRKEIPKERSCKPNQIKGRIRFDGGVLGKIERFTILLTPCFVFCRKLITHEHLTFLHSRKTDRTNSTIKVNDLQNLSLCRNSLMNASNRVVKSLLRCGILHDIVSVEIIVCEGKVALGKRQCKKNLRNPCMMFDRIWVGFQ